MVTEPSYSDYHDEMWEIVNSLDEEFRTVIILFYYNDMPLKDIAEHLNIAQGTVKSRLNRGRNKLKELIQLQP